MNSIKKLLGFFKKRKKITLALIVLLLIVGFFVRKSLANSSGKPSYQTATVQKGTLVSALSASGVISAGSTNDITTNASGVVKEVLVKNGQTVTKGQKLATITLDDEGQSRQVLAWAAYIDTVNAEKTAETSKVTADIQMWKDRQAIFDALEVLDDKNNDEINPQTKEKYTESEKAIVDKTVDQKRKAFDASETAYKNADAQISKAKAQISSAWRSYQKASATITAPMAGVVTNFTLTPGLTLVSSSASSSNESDGNGSSVSSQKIGSISNSNAQYQAVVNLSEIDVVKVNPDQKVSLTLDAFPDKTFTGKVLSIDTAGKVSSGVTAYPTTILLDSTPIKIYPNMSVTANIITNSKTDVLLIPNSAIQNQNGETVVRTLDDKGQLQYLPVVTGLSSDSETEIVSGVAEGVEVVTAVSNPNAKNSSGASSPFSTMRMGGMGGNTSRQQVRIER